MEVLRPTGELLGHATIEPDWEPAVEWTRLAGLRTRGIWAPGAEAERAIDALWHAELGEPFTRGFRVTFADAVDREWHEEFSIHYFADAARSVAATLVAKGALAAGDRYLYRVLAYEPDTPVASDTDGRFAAADAPPPLPIHDVQPGALLDASPRHADAQVDDFEVYIPGAVLDEAEALTAGAGDLETGGILIGHLGRVAAAATAATVRPDTSTSDICVAVSALVPARHTIGHATKLTFTSDTWTDVRRTVALRRRGELVLGWFHSHPQLAWCREQGCSPDAQQRCTAAAGFFSADDVALHRTVFPRAFTVALLMTHSVQGILPRLFGWRAGLLEPRGYRVLTHPLSFGELPHAAPVAV